MKGIRLVIIGTKLYFIYKGYKIIRNTVKGAAAWIRMFEGDRATEDDVIETYFVR